MSTKVQLSYTALLLMISFASVNAVLFTPALPQITTFFAISTESAQLTISWFLIAYTAGQLIYGPLSNRFGRKPALYSGICLQILSSLLCVLSGKLHYYPLLVIGRFFLALGSGVGLKMTYTLVNEVYQPQEASRKISYLMLAFAITPGLAIALGGILSQHYGWISCFYASAIYGLIVLFIVMPLPETQKILNPNALKLGHLFSDYAEQVKNKQLLFGSLLMGLCTCFIYVFATLAPFIAINLLGMTSTQYGLANILPPLGLISGSLLSAQLTKRYPLQFIIRIGIGITSLGTIAMITALYTDQAALLILFLPLVFIYFGLSLIIANASVLAMSQVRDKSQGSAVMSFVNMGLATTIVLSLGFFPLNTAILPTIFFFLCGTMITIYKNASFRVCHQF